jgi:hypothetical protein
MIGIPLPMTLDDLVSGAISFRLATSFGKDGSKVLCIILMMPEVDVKVGPNLLNLVINTKPPFSNMLFTCLQQKSAGTSQQVLSSQILMQICPCPSPFDGLGVKHERDAY